MRLGPTEFERCLAEIKPRIGRYNWMWRLLRARARVSGALPIYRALRVLDRFIPYGHQDAHALR